MSLMEIDEIFDDVDKAIASPFHIFNLMNMPTSTKDERMKSHKLKDYNPAIAMDVSETKDKIKVKVDLPGMEKNDIKIVLKDDGKTLCISGETKEDKKEENETYHVIQRRFGKFEKHVRLPKNRCDLEKIHAEMKNGVLCIEIPKKEPPKQETKQIQIQ